MPGRVIAIWLDGFDMHLADAYALPNLSRLGREGMVATLDNGSDHLTGLTGEHISSGLNAHDSGRSSAVLFDPSTYHCVQEGSRFSPIFTGVQTVVFDWAYFDLSGAGSDVVGVTDWGVHDPGNRPQARPSTLHTELVDRFGRYPARQWIYGVPWASVEACKEMGEALSKAARTRSDVARWLLSERFTDWQVALVGFAESHSASEGLFHGVGSSHPWSGLESTPEAGRALRSVYSAIDQAVGEIVEAFPEDTVVIFSMHGMGPNNSDVPSMALLGEVMSRWSGLGTPSMQPFTVDAAGIPQLAPDSSWTSAVLGHFMNEGRRTRQSVRARIKQRVPEPLRRILGAVRSLKPGGTSVREGSLQWMPLMRHQPDWHAMKAFALPSFYDGRVRVNLIGRESCGIVGIEEFGSVIDQIEGLLRECTEPRSGQPVVKSVRRVEGNPLTRQDDDVDLIVHWEDDVLGISHPRLGIIGPLPPRRTGGHSNPIGRCLIVGHDVQPGDIGVRSSFDVVPTILSLAGASAPHEVSGSPLPFVCR